MTSDERIIYTKLILNPGMTYITPDGQQLYLLVTGGMMCLTGPDFNLLNEADINKFIQDALTQTRLVN